MLVTEAFVMLNYPKTGSSFARKVVKEIYERHPRQFFKRRFVKELMLPNIREAGNPPPDQHGMYSQIPVRYRDREVVTVVRNPYERFLSGYEFRAWANCPPLPVGVIRKSFARFPRLSIHEYIDFNQYALGPSVFRGPKPRATIGEQTAQFIQLFFKNPQSILARITDEYLDSNCVFDDMADITFLRRENLNHQLAEFSQRKGFTHAETSFIESHAPVNVTQGTSADRSKLLTPRVVDYVTVNERMIFRILKAKGISCECPAVAAQAA
jgi:hypothetical protein